jgi:hypothetical protein
MTKSKILLAVIVGFITLIFITSCNKDLDQNDLASLQNSQSEVNSSSFSNCQKPFHEISSYSDGAHLIENFLYVEKDYDKVNGLDSKEKYFNHYNNLSIDNANATATFALHGQKYKDLGHDGYIDYATNQGLLSQELNTYLKSFRTNFVNFINTTHPNFDSYKAYIESKGVELLSNNTLCDYDKYVAKVYHVSLLGIGKYIYDTHYTNSITLGSLEVRSCEGFWQKLACGSGGVIVGTVVGVAVGVWKWVKGIFSGKKDGKEVTLIEALYQVYKISVDMWKTGVKFYDWCCETLFGEDIVNCGDPTGCWANELGCNDYMLNVVGPGLYTITNWGPLSNLVVASNVTPEPRVRASVPDVNNVSIIQGNTLCTDQNGNSTKAFQFVRQIGGSQPFPTPVWGYEPPTNANKNQSYNVNVINPPTQGSMYTMSLSSSWGYNFTLITGGMLTFTGYISGTYWVEVTYTHICTGETHKVGKWVTVGN